METTGKYWIRQNKDHTPRDTIKSLRKQDSDQENPTYEEDSKKMAEMTRDYHQELQNIGLQETTEEDYNEVLLHLNTKLNQADKNLLATFIRYEEVEEALHLLPNGTAAGLDGLPHEFWKNFASRFTNDKKNGNPAFDIIKCLKTVFNEIEKTGPDPQSSFASGWMCPIYKKGEKSEIANYRPITVLNTDYKIMTRTLTTRLANITPKIIHKDQAGFMKGRRIEDQTELVKLLIR